MRKGFGFPVKLVVYAQGTAVARYFEVEETHSLTHAHTHTHMHVHVHAMCMWHVACALFAVK